MKKYAKWLWCSAYSLIIILPLSSIGQDPAQALAVAGFAMLVLQLVLVGRLHSIERWFGLDQLLRWRRWTGSIAAVIVALAVFLPGTFFPTGGWLLWYWLGLGGLAVGMLLYRSAVVPLWVRQHPYEIESIHETVKGVRTITFVPQQKYHFNYHPGQFLFVQFLSKNIKKEWHPFTIFSSPTEPNIMLSIKESGDWTSTLGELLPGDKALIEAPFGVFSFTLQPTNRPLVFIAGGIGITPLRSMLKYISDQALQRDVTLLYGNRRVNEIAFRTELDQLAKQQGPIRIVHVLSQDQDWTGERGHIDAACLKKYIPNITACDYFICGPVPMMQSLKRILHDYGVAKRFIHTEEFALK